MFRIRAGLSWATLTLDDAVMCAGSTPQSLMFDINNVYNHVYYSEGVYQVTANISSHMSWAFLTAQIIVATPVVNMIWVMPVSHASINVPFVAGVTMDMGTNVTLVWDFGDASVSAVDSKMRIGKFQCLVSVNNCVVLKQFYFNAI